MDDLPTFANPVITIGSFDGVHTGHRKILEKIKELARQANGESIVITFDPHPRHFLFPNDNSLKLISSTSEQVELLDELGIDYTVVVPFDQSFANQSPETYIEEFLIKKFNPKYIVIGYNHRFGKDRAGDISLLRQYEKENEFSIIEIAKEEIDDIAVSSTKIRNALLSGEIENANKFLQHNFKISGEVVHGQKLGKSLGYPTANLVVENKHKLIPPDGIYAVYTIHNGKRYQSMLYIGKRPTLKNLDNKTIEVNIFNFNQEIYGDELELEFISKIRDDQQFRSLEDLKNQIAKDKIASLQVFETQGEAESTKKKTKVTVVILNYNGVGFLEKYLPFLQKTTYDNYQIIVADNASTDDSVAFLEKNFPNIEILKILTNLGFAKGYNEALKDLSSDLFVLLNSDVEVSPGWLEPIVEIMDQDSSVAACQPKVLDINNRTQFEYAGAAGGWIDRYGYPFCRGRIFDELESDQGQYNDVSEVFWASGAAMVIRADLFKKLGGLDGDYWAHHEEIDLCWRLKRAGFKIMSCPQSVVYHVGGGSLNYGNPKKTFLNFRNSLYSIHKNTSGGKRFKMIFTRLILDALAGIQFLLKGQGKDFGALVRAHWSYFGSIGQLKRKHKEDLEKIAQHAISKETNESGIYRGSIVWAYFIKGKRSFKNLF